MEERFTESENKRSLRETQLQGELDVKESILKEQKVKLGELESVYKESKEKSDLKIKGLVEHFLDRRTAETARLKVKMKEIIQIENKDICSREIAEKKIEMKNLWHAETEKVAAQEKVFGDLQNELHELMDKFESQSSSSDEDKIEFEKMKQRIEEDLATAVDRTEELHAARERALSTHKGDYRNRFDLLCWEREKEEEKIENKKTYLREQISRQIDWLESTVVILKESKEKYDDLVKIEEEALTKCREDFDQRKATIKANCDRKQNELDKEVRKFQEIDKSLTRGIEDGRLKLDTLKLELGRAMVDLKHSGDDCSALESNVKAKTKEISDLEGTIKTLDDDRTAKRIENEEKVQEKLHELNMLNVELEEEIAFSSKKYTEMEQLSREKILLQQESVDDAEKQLLQCRNNLDRNEERLQELQKLEEGSNAKADNELLFIAYLLEKDLEEKGKTEEYEAFHNCKNNVENIASQYKEEVSVLQKEVDDQLNPLVLQREEAQVVLEDLLRSRGISEVALNELKEQFCKERSAEIADIDRLKEKLADLEEEASLSMSLERDEITHTGHSDLLNINRILEKERQR